MDTSALEVLKQNSAPESQAPVSVHHEKLGMLKNAVSKPTPSLEPEIVPTSVSTVDAQENIINNFSDKPVFEAPSFEAVESFAFESYETPIPAFEKPLEIIQNFPVSPILPELEVKEVVAAPLVSELIIDQAPVVIKPADPKNILKTNSKKTAVRGANEFQIAMNKARIDAQKAD
jgi:hypothetical protein